VPNFHFSPSLSAPRHCSVADDEQSGRVRPSSRSWCASSARLPPKPIRRVSPSPLFSIRRFFRRKVAAGSPLASPSGTSRKFRSAGREERESRGDFSAIDASKLDQRRRETPRTPRLTRDRVNNESPRVGEISPRGDSV